MSENTSVEVTTTTSNDVEVVQPDRFWTATGRCGQKVVRKFTRKVTSETMPLFVLDVVSTDGKPGTALRARAAKGAVWSSVPFATKAEAQSAADAAMAKGDPRILDVVVKRAVLVPLPVADDNVEQSA